MLFINKHYVSTLCGHHVLGTIRRLGNNDRDNLSLAIKSYDSKINLALNAEHLRKTFYELGFCTHQGPNCLLYDLLEIPISSR